MNNGTTHQHAQRWIVHLSILRTRDHLKEFAVKINISKTRLNLQTVRNKRLSPKYHELTQKRGQGVE